MAKEGTKEKQKEKSIIDGWLRLSKEYHAGEVKEQDKELFEKDRFAETQSKKKKFVLWG